MNSQNTSVNYEINKAYRQDQLRRADQSRLAKEAQPSKRNGTSVIKVVSQLLISIR